MPERREVCNEKGHLTLSRGHLFRGIRTQNSRSANQSLFFKFLGKDIISFKQVTNGSVRLLATLWY